MNKELIIQASPQEVVVALLEDQVLVELHREKSDGKHAVGDVYLGRIKKVMPGLNAAFVDVGSDKDGFLHVLDLGPQIKTLQAFTNQSINPKGEIPSIARVSLRDEMEKSEKIGTLLKQNQPLLVQIIKEPISTKGPRICSEISFAGRYIVLIPFSNKISISTKIKSAEERNRLKYSMQSLLPKNFGVIIRTVAEGKSVADLDADLRSLLDRWEVLARELKGAQAPKLIVSEQDKTMTILRDMLNKDFNSIVVNQVALFEEIKKYLLQISPDKVDIVKLYRSNDPIFDHYGITKQIKASFGKVVPIRRGGAYLVVEHTEALHVIDVNSGHKMNAEASQENNALAVNLESAEEIARQLRLRDMGGIIVVDFIDQREAKNRKILFDRMVELMEKDPAKHNVLPPTKFGLVQITRQRVRPQTNIDVQEKCPVCNGTGEVKSNILLIDEIEHHLEYLSQQQNMKKLSIMLNPFVYAYITKGFWSIRRRWNRKFGIRLRAESTLSMHYLEYRFYDADGEEIRMES